MLLLKCNIDEFTVRINRRSLRFEIDGRVRFQTDWVLVVVYVVESVRSGCRHRVDDVVNVDSFGFCVVVIVSFDWSRRLV